MKRFILFAGIYNDRIGGAHDLQGAFDDEHAAQAHYDFDQLKEFEWAHIYDCGRQCIVCEMSWKNYKPQWLYTHEENRDDQTCETFKATLVKKLNNWQNLYKLSPPYNSNSSNIEYVVVSTAYALFGGPETAVFATDQDGNILNEHQLPGSFKGWHDDQDALHGLDGYIISKT